MAFVMEAKSRADQLRVPLVIVVANTHEEGKRIIIDNGLADGKAIVLSVPKSAATNLQQLNEVSQASEVPRLHIFPPAAAGVGNQPMKVAGLAAIAESARRWTHNAGVVIPESQEVHQALQSFGSAATAWNSVQSRRQPQQQQQQVAAAATTAAPNVPVASSVAKDSAPSSQASPQPTKPASAAPAAHNASDAAPQQQQQALGTHSKDDYFTPGPRLQPRINVRLHATARANTELVVPSQSRTIRLNDLRKIIADAADKSFQNNFRFLRHDTLERVRGDDEHRLIAQDISNGETVYILPELPADAAPAAATAAAAKPAVAPGQVRIKITYPDDTSEIVTFDNTATASVVFDKIAEKVGHREFFMQLPRGRVRDEELSSTLADLNVGRSVMLRVYDIQAQREKAAEYEAKQAEDSASASSGLTGMLSSLASGARTMLRGSSSADGADGAASGGDTNKSNNESNNAMNQRERSADQPPPTAAPRSGGGGAPRSMAEMRRLQEEEEERKKKAAGGTGNTFWNGDGTNVQDPRQPPPPPPK